jgi:hypothetical protein
MTITQTDVRQLQTWFGTGGQVAQPFVNMLAYGADPTGATDSTAAMQAAINAAIVSNLGAMVIVPPGTYKLSSTVTITSVLGLHVLGVGHQSKFIWAGASNVPMFKLADCRKVTLSYLNITASTTTPLQNAIQVLNDGSVNLVTSQSNRFDSLWIQGTNGGITTCVVIGGTGALDANNDFMEFRNCKFSNYSAYGVEITHAQSYNNQFTNCQFSNGQCAVHVTNGYFMWTGGSVFAHTLADFYFGSPSVNLPFLIQYVTSEASTRFVDTVSTAGPHLTLRNCRVAGNGIASDGEMIRLLQSAHIVIDTCVFNNGNMTSGPYVPFKVRYAPSTGLARHPGSSFQFTHNTIYDPNTSPANPFSVAFPTRQSGNKFQNESTLDAVAIDREYGTTAQRPTMVGINFMYFDTDLGQWIWWSGTAWQQITAAFTNADNAFSVAQGIRASNGGLAGGLYVPGVVGDTVAAIRAGIASTGYSQAGVFALSDSSSGVLGTSNSGPGVSGQSASGYAIDATAIPSSGSTVALGLRVRNATAAAGANGSGVVQDFLLKSDTTSSRSAARLAATWVSATDASRTARLVLSVYDTTAREALRAEATGTAVALGFYGATAQAKQTITGSRGANAALASLITALANLGLLTDSTTV